MMRVDRTVVVALVFAVVLLLLCSAQAKDEKQDVKRLSPLEKRAKDQAVAEDDDDVDDDDVDDDDDDDDDDQPMHFRAAKKLKKVESVEDYADGDLDPELIAKAVPEFQAMVGKWEILPKRSEPTDAILAALGVSFIKRSVLKKAITQVQIADLKKSEDQRDFTVVKSFLPMNTIKEGQVFIDNKPFSVVDKDTGIWKSTAMLQDGRLLQKRVSKKGIMYDVRATFEADPEGIVLNKPLHLFKWTFITRKGQKFVAHRWFYKLEDAAGVMHTE